MNHKRLLKTILLSLPLSVFSLYAAPEPQSLRSPVVFEPNQGQAPKEIKWIARGPDYQFLLTAKGATIVLQDRTKTNRQPASTLETEELSTGSRQPLSTLRMRLSGSRTWSDITGLDATGGIGNYLLGNDPKHWHTGIRQYSRVRVPNVYRGIDLVFYGRNGQLEYDFIVTPGADPEQIRMGFDGAKDVRVDDKSGDLVVKTENGPELRHIRPRIYQEIANKTVEVAGGYKITDRQEAAFTLAAYDRRNTLLIDPTIVFTRFLAGSNEDVGAKMTVDGSGNSYVTGFTLSTDFPAPFQSAPGISDAFVTKLSPTGNIIFSTYLGGDGIDIGHGIAVDSEGVYVTGFTNSRNFPSRDHRGPKGADAFITKLSPNTGGMIYTFFLGGTNTEDGLAIAVDSTHAPYVVGTTASSDFPAFGALQTQFGGDRDGFVAKLNPAGYYLDYASFIGGSGFESANNMAIDNAGFIYITGVTTSADFPTVGPSQGFPAGGSSTAFITKIKPGGLGMVYSIYFGGGADSGLAISADANGNAYIAGITTSFNVPTSSIPFQKTKLSPASAISAFVTRISDPGVWVFSTYLNGSDGDTNANAIAINRSGEIYVAGDTSSTTFPGAPPIRPNPTAGFLVKLTPALNALNYTVFLGAQINGLAVLQPVSRLPILTLPQIYTSGFRFTGGTNATNADAFVVRLDEVLVNHP
jgi:hypothetical protein